MKAKPEDINIPVFLKDPANSTALARYAPTVRRRGAIERIVVTALIQALKAEGYNKLATSDGEEEFEHQSEAEMLETLFSVDEATIMATHDEGGGYGEIFLVFGNDGWDVISDYNTSLDPFLEEFMDWVEEQRELNE